MTCDAAHLGSAALVGHVAPPATGDSVRHASVAVAWLASPIFGRDDTSEVR